MHRRNFFSLVGAASVALGGYVSGATAGVSQEGGVFFEPVSGPNFLIGMSETFAGTQIDQDIVGIAQSASAQLQGTEPKPPKTKVRVFFGPWCCLVVVNGTKAYNWTNTDTAFGTDYKTLPLSEMLSIAAKSQYATKNFQLKIEADGSVFVTS